MFLAFTGECSIVYENLSCLCRFHPCACTRWWVVLCCVSLAYFFGTFLAQLSQVHVVGTLAGRVRISQARQIVIYALP